MSEPLSERFVQRLVQRDPGLACRAARQVLDAAGERLKSQIAIDPSTYRVEPGATLDLARLSAEPSGLPGEKALLRQLTEREHARLDKLQRRLYAEHRHKILIVFQATDTGGKDGSIRNLCSGLNPQGVKVACFKAPTAVELDHDPLWRIHPHVPARGEISIFNRSHYEDVLITRVHGLIDDELGQRRLRHIQAFEEMLADEGATILKFFLHIDRDEQKRRLLARQADPEKHWKLSPDDLKERALWDDYQRVYAETLSATSTARAPWYLIPANDKKRRDLIVATLVRKRLQALNPQTPAPGFDVAGLDIV